jgi:hypothetical protein
MSKNQSHGTFFAAFFYASYEAAKLGGRPKSVSEEDMSALFFGNCKITFTGFADYTLHLMESFRRRDGSHFYCAKGSLFNKSFYINKTRGFALCRNSFAC